MKDTIIGLDEQPGFPEPPKFPDANVQAILSQAVLPISINGWQSFGLQKRELFAALILANNQHASHDTDIAVRAAVKAADALFAALNPKPEVVL